MTPVELEKFFEQHSKEYRFSYPDIFDPTWVIKESEWPFFRLSALDKQPYSEMYKEAYKLYDKFYEHREAYGKGWRSLTLNGLDEDTQTLDSYGDRKQTIEKLDWTWVADACPITKKFLTDVWPSEYLNRVRFMLLEPGGYILPHQDRPDTQKRLSVCNISLNNPAGCEFVMKNQGTVPFDPNGSAMLMDISNVHAVWNRSNEPRIHMIIHFEIGRRIRDFFYVLRESYHLNRNNNV